MRALFALITSILLLVPTFASATENNKAVVRWEAIHGHGYWCSAPLPKADARKLAWQARGKETYDASAPSVWDEGSAKYVECLSNK